MAESLHLAIVDGDMSAVRQMLGSGDISPDASVRGVGPAPLCVALEHGLDDIAVLLVESGADIYRYKTTVSSAREKVYIRLCAQK